jgi:hypothetical protein
LFFDKLGERLGIRSKEDWYSIPADVVLKNGGKFIITYYKKSLIRGNFYHSVIYRLSTEDNLS